MNTALPERRITVAYLLVQSGYWGVMAAFCGYQTAILLGRGFSGSAAGMFLSLGCAAGIVTQPLLGHWADRHPEMPLKRLLGGSLLAALAVHVVFYAARPGLAGCTVIFLLLGALETNAYSLVDAMIMQFINVGVDVPYSLGRGMGALAYALVGAAVGWLAQGLGVEFALVIHGLLLLFVLVCVVLFPAFPREMLPPRAERAAPHSALRVLRANPPFFLMLCGGFFAMAAVMPTSNFLVSLVSGRGGGSGALGLAMFLMAASELPGALLFQRLRRSVKSQWILLISFAFITAKPLLFLCGGGLTALLAMQPLQMMGYGLFTPANVYFANESVPPEDRVQGQMLKMVCTNGLGGAAGNLAAGRVLDWRGTTALLWMLVLFGAAALVFGMCSVLARRRMERTTGENV